MVPMNLGLIYLMFKFQRPMAQSIQRFASSPRRQAHSKFIMIGSSLLMSFSMMGILLGANFGVMGMNPVALFKEESKRDKTFEEQLNKMVIGKTNDNVGIKWQDLPENIRNLMTNQSFNNMFLLALSQLLGLSEDTQLIIEQDLRNQAMAELIIEREMNN